MGNFLLRLVNRLYQNILLFFCGKLLYCWEVSTDNWEKYNFWMSTQTILQKLTVTQCIYMLTEKELQTFYRDSNNWQQVQKLMSHTLTVVQLQFSPDSSHLLSVSRDRRWTLFSRNEKDEFELVSTTNKATAVHTRIIWTCSWSHDSKYFATGWW